MTRSISLVLTLGLLLAAAGCSGSRQTAEEPAAPGEWITLFDGSSLDGWQMAGPGEFVLAEDGTMVSQGGMGLFYYAAKPFRDFVLELDWKVENDSANSGVFVRFPEKTDDPWYAVNNGYEIQINDTGDPLHGTGAVYSFSGLHRPASKPAGEWNSYRIEVTGQRYQIYLNGEKVNDFIGDRGRQGYIGLQNHDDHSKVWFRNVRVMPLATSGPESLAELVATQDGEARPIRVLSVSATHGWRHADAIEKSKEVLAEVAQTTEFEFDFTDDAADLNAQKLAGYDVLLFNNATLRTESNDGTTLLGRYDVTLQTDDGPLNGFVQFDGVPGAMTGSITFPSVDATPAALQEPVLAGRTVSFTFDGGEYGTINGRSWLEGDSLKGSLEVRGARLALTGVRSGAGESEVLVTEAQRQAILDFLAAGKGVAVVHAGLDAFYGWDAYREMVGGGLFAEHPWTQPVRITIEEPGDPTVEHLGDGFWIRDEIYVLDENPRWNSRVLASLDMESVGIEQGPADATANDYPISWVRRHEGGRVFVTKLGHFPDVWATPGFLRHLLQGLRVAAGRIEADLGGQRVKEVIAENVWPDDIAVDERGNVWIAELRGKVHRYDAATGTTAQIAHINTTDPTKIEHGLYGIEVDPAFYDGEPYVYLFYAEPETFINTLSRFEYRNGQLDVSTEKVLLRVPTEPNCCHQAGDLEWGPDGTLYVSTGDTGMSETRPEWEISQERIDAFQERNDLTGLQWSRLVDSERSAQNLTDLRGKILRINKDGSIPKDNPFFGQPGVRWEIYAYGLRNPYRFKVDPTTNELYIAVVGPDEVMTYDEYNLSEKGGENFGWPRSIGRLFYNEITPEEIPGFVPPLWEYTYETGGRSATFGPIYRSNGPNAFPAAFQDKVFLFDWARRWIKWADVEESTFTSDSANSVKEGQPTFEIPTRRLTNIKTFDQLLETAPISMEIGPDGSIYVAEFDGFWDAGPKARVTRYRWIDDDEAAANASTTEETGSGTR